MTKITNMKFVVLLMGIIFINLSMTAQVNHQKGGFGLDPSQTQTLIDKSGANLPEIINDGNNRSAAYDGSSVFVVSRKGGSFIYRWNVATPAADPTTLDLTGVSGGTWNISDVRMAGGKLYVSNMVMAADAVFKVYRWDDLSAQASSVISYTIPAAGIRLGDAFSIIGDPAVNGKIIAPNFSNTAQWYVFEFENGVLTPASPTVVTLAAAQGTYGRVNAIAGVSNRYVSTGSNVGIQLMNENFEVLATIPGIPTVRTYDPRIFTFNGARYLSYVENPGDVGTLTNSRYVIIDISEGESMQSAFEAITEDNIVSKTVYSKVLGPKSAFFSSTLNVSFTPENNPLLMAFAVGGGFVVEKFFDFPPSDDASLADLKVNGLSVSGFNPSTNSYNIELPFGVAPVVKATANNAFAQVKILQAASVPGNAQVIVTAENGIATQTYTLQFTYSAFAIGNGLNPALTQNLIDKAGANIPDIISGGNNRSAAFDGQYVYVASRLNGNFVYYWDVENPSATQATLNLTGVSGGTWSISDVKTVGQTIYVSNMVMAADAVFKVYRWNHKNAQAEVVLSYVVPAGGIRLGDAISIIGNPQTNGKIIATNFSNTAQAYVFEFVNGELTPASPTVVTMAVVQGSYGRINQIFGVSNRYVATGSNVGIHLMDENFNILATVPGIPTVRSYDARVFHFNGKRYLAYVENPGDVGVLTDARYVVLDISEGADLQAAFEAVTEANIVSKTVYTKVLGPKSGFFSSTLNVQYNAQNQPMLMAFAVGSGFVVDYFIEFQPSSDATLTDLKVNGTTVTGFAPDVLVYNVELPFGTTELPVVSATATDANAIVAINQATELPGQASVLVTAEDGIAENTYTLNFTVAPFMSDEAEILSFVLDEQTAPASINSASATVSIEVAYGTSLLALVPTITISESATIDPQSGVAQDFTNAVVYTVTAQNGDEKEWTVSVSVVLPSIDATLSDLKVDGSTIPGFNPATLAYEIELPFGTTVIPQVSAVANHPAATLVVTQAAQLPGSATVVVTAQDGTTSITYSVNFSLEAASNDASLSELKVNGVNLSAFSPEVFEYTYELPYGTTEIPVVSAVVNDPTANMVITQAAVLPGDAVVAVTAQDGNTVLVYTVSFVLGEEPQYIYVAETLIDKTSGSGLMPDILNDGSSRSVAFNGTHVFAATRKNGNHIYVYEINSKDNPAELDMTNVSGGTFGISDVRVVGEHLYGSNMVMSSGQAFKVYRWSSLTAAAEVLIEYTIGADMRLGDAISMIGNPAENGKIVATNFSINNNAYVWNFTNGVLQNTTPEVWTLDLGVDGNGVPRLIGQYGRYNEIADMPGHYLVSGAFMGVGLVNFSGNQPQLLAEAAVGIRSYDPHVFHYNGARFLTYTFNNEASPVGAKYYLIDITEGGDLQNAIATLTPDNLLSKTIHERLIGEGSPWNSSCNNVAFTADGRPMIMASVAQRGFIVQRFTAVENNALSLPFHEPFNGEGENTPATWLPEGWISVDSDGDTRNWYWDAFEDEAYMLSASYAGGQDLTPDNWLITPAIDLTVLPGQTIQLSYLVAPTANTPAYREEHYSVLISTTDNAIGSFTEIFEETLLQSYPNWEWIERSIDLTEYEGQIVYVAFRHHQSTGLDRIALDEVKIEAVGDIYTVNFEVKNSDNEIVDDAVITFAGITNAAGNYEFQVVGGTYDYAVSRLGYFPVEVTGVVVSADMTITVVLQFVSVAQLQQQLLNIYPNPANTMVQIESGVMIEELTIMDITGKTVFQQRPSKHQLSIDVQNFETGLYFVRIASPMGVITRKLQVVK